MHNAIFLPPFGALSDPLAMADLAAAAEEAGWDGLFLWDHVLRPANEPQEISDVWVMLAAVAFATTRLRIGPMVTPVTRRRPHKLAREAITLDRLSAGRLTLGLGLGVDTSGELSRFGEVVDARERGAMLDEAVELLVAYLGGERVDHRGAYYVASDVQLLPPSLQLPRVPLWFAARGQARRPVRRAARYEGLFAVDVDVDDLSAMASLVAEERGGLDGFDLAVVADEHLEPDDAEQLGVTWLMWSLPPQASLEEVRARIGSGPSW